MAKGKVITQKLITLAMIVAAGADGMFTTAAVHQPLVDAGLVEVNPSVTNDAGEVATRATQAGIDKVASDNSSAFSQSQGNGETNVAKTSFAIVGTVPVPVGAGRGRAREAVYPFEQLEVGQSFFVPNSEDKPEVAKSLASTVSSATARFAVQDGDKTEVVNVSEYQVGDDGKRVKGPEGKLVKIGEHQEERAVMVQTRKFIVRPVADGAPWGFTGISGAGVWRTA